MMRMRRWRYARLILWGAWLAAAASVAPAADEIKIALRKAAVAQYDPFHFDILLLGDYVFENPFDPEEIRVDARLKTPSGKSLNLPCFYNPCNTCSAEWEGRFTPRETGTYAIRATVARRGKKTISSASQTFQVTPSAKDGFLSRDPRSNAVFRFDSGRSFRGVGINFGWEKDEHTYELMLERLSAHGGNFARTWMCPWNLPLEWREPGLGRYNLKSAKRLDQALELARKHGIYLMLTLDYHGVLNATPDHWGINDEWKNNPYNAANGGPCPSLTDFFTNRDAREMYRRRLRYLVARWGYSPNIAAWELWNEIEHIKADPKAVVAWHREMAAYLKAIDPHPHLVSTSSQDLPGLWEIPELDFSQHHRYGSLHGLPGAIALYSSKYRKPHIVGEFSYEWRTPGETGKEEPYSRELRLGLWRGMFSETPVLPLTWWWEFHERRGDFLHIATAADFLSGVMQKSGGSPRTFNPGERGIRLLAPPGEVQSKNLHLRPEWGFSPNPGNRIVIQESGFIPKAGETPQFLFSPKARKDFHNPPEFEITYREDGQFHVHVGRISANGLLRLHLDGQLALEKPLPLGAGAGEWESSEYKAQWGSYQGVYNKEYGVPVKAGRHVIKVENTGADWVEVKDYIFRNCGVPGASSLEIMGLQAGDDLYLWWRPHEKVAESTSRKSPGTLLVPSLAPGQYTVAFYDTWSGGFSAPQHLSFQTGASGFRIVLPHIESDAACRIQRIGP